MSRKGRRKERIGNKSPQSPTKWVWGEKEECAYGYGVFTAPTETVETEWNRRILTSRKGLVKNAWICLPIGIVMTIVVLFILRATVGKKTGAAAKQ